MKREIRVYLSFSYAKYQGLCSCGAIFLRAPTVSELPSALLEMRTLFCNCVAEQGRVDLDGPPRKKATQMGGFALQGLCSCGAIFLALPPPRERADALRRECEPYSATVLQSKVESKLMVHHAKKPPKWVALRGGPSRTRTLDQPVMSRWL